MTLTPTDVMTLYKKHVAINNTPEYLNRYHPFEKYYHKNNKKWKWENKDFARIISLLEFERYIDKYNIFVDKFLMINGENDPELDYMDGRYSQYLSITYESNPEKYDLHNFSIFHSDFNFVCVNQTLEHVYHPILCLANIRNYMAKDGYLYLNVPSNNVPHSDPYHYYTGFTPVGLACVAKMAGFEILEIGQWGNREYMDHLYGITTERKWPDYRQLKNAGVNEFNTPITTWGLFKNIK